MRKIHGGPRSQATAILVRSLCVAILSLPGCSREERGPTLSGGREIKSWVDDLRSPKAQVRRTAVLKLGNAGDSDPAVAVALAEALLDREPLVRREAIRAVAKLKDPGAAVKERLETMSRTDKDATTRDLAAKALVRVGGAS
jgi:hypothetical protein